MTAAAAAVLRDGVAFSGVVGRRILPASDREASVGPFAFLDAEGFAFGLGATALASWVLPSEPTRPNGADVDSEAEAESAPPAFLPDGAVRGRAPKFAVVVDAADEAASEERSLVSEGEQPPAPVAAAVGARREALSGVFATGAADDEGCCLSFPPPSFWCCGVDGCAAEEEAAVASPSAVAAAATVERLVVRIRAVGIVVVAVGVPDRRLAAEVGDVDGPADGRRSLSLSVSLLSLAPSKEFDGRSGEGSVGSSPSPSAAATDCFRLMGRFGDCFVTAPPAAVAAAIGAAALAVGAAEESDLAPVAVLAPKAPRGAAAAVDEGLIVVVDASGLAAPTRGLPAKPFGVGREPAAEEGATPAVVTSGAAAGCV